jgi:hypothetical protein
LETLQWYEAGRSRGEHCHRAMPTGSEDIPGAAAEDSAMKSGARGGEGPDQVSREALVHTLRSGGVIVAAQET